MSSKFLRYWLFEITVPLAILGGAVVVFLAFGKAESKKRPFVGGSPEARLALLPAAEVEPCGSLELTGGLLNIRAHGTVVPAREIQQAAEVSGPIVFKSPQCDAGQYVEKGELLIRIDPTDYELEIERLNKILVQEQEALREIDQELENTIKLIELASQELTLQDNELKRLESLPAGFASDTELDRVRTTRLQTINKRTQATNQQQLLEKRRVRLEASLMLAQTQLKRARKDLERTEIRAATNGLVVQDNAELSSFVQRGTIVVTLEEAGRMEVAADLRMDQLHWVLDQASDAPLLQSRESGLISAPNQKTGYELPPTATTVMYRVSGRDNETLTWEGRLERYEGVGLDAKTRMVPVRVVVDEPRRAESEPGAGPALLMRGMFVELIIHTQPKTPLVLVPSLAMRPGGRVWKFVANPDLLNQPRPGEKVLSEATSPAPVTTNEDASVEVKLEDWLAGQLVVVDSLQPVTEVQIQETEAGSPTAKSYWICETSGNLLPGDTVITTPLAGIAADGSDAVRIPLHRQRDAPQTASNALR